MKMKSIVGFVLMILIFSVINLSCAQKEKGQVYDKGKEGQWVYSTQKTSPSGDRKSATTYSKRPYAGTEGGDAALASTEPKPVIAPYLLGRLKYKVVIAEFQDNSVKGARGLGALVTQQLAKQLEESGAVVVVDMELVKKSIGAGDAGALATPSTVGKLRALLGVQGLVTGIIQDTLVGTSKQTKTAEAMAITKMNILVYDTESGNIIRSIKGENPLYTSRAVGELSQDKALNNAVNFALQEVTDGILRGLAGLEWSTSVASLEGDKLYLNAGKSSGLKVGDELEIYNPGRQVKHQITGVSLGRLPGTLLGKVKVSQFLGFDAAEAKITSGGSISTGDEARLAK